MAPCWRITLINGHYHAGLCPAGWQSSTEWLVESRKGTAGNLYKYNNPYTNTRITSSWSRAPMVISPRTRAERHLGVCGAPSGGCTETGSWRFNAAGYLFHGQLKGNLNVEIACRKALPVLWWWTALRISRYIHPGKRASDVAGASGYPCYNTQSVADKLAASGDHSVLISPRHSVRRTGRTAVLPLTGFTEEHWFWPWSQCHAEHHAWATDSTVTLGDSRVFIDKNDGTARPLRWKKAHQRRWRMQTERV